MLRRLLRDFGSLNLILVVGGCAFVLAKLLGGDGVSSVVLLSTFVAWLGWWAFIRTMGEPVQDPDPFGRSGREAWRHEMAGRRAMKTPLRWSSATVDNCPDGVWRRLSDAIEMAPDFIAAADGVTWLATERDCFGWPDPPRYVVVAFDADGEVVAAADFNKWPKRWNRPAELATD